MGRRPITATDREWGQQCQDCQPHGEEMKEDGIQSTQDTPTTAAATGMRGVGIAEEQGNEHWRPLTLQKTIGLGSNCHMHRQQSQEDRTRLRRAESTKDKESTTALRTAGTTQTDRWASTSDTRPDITRLQAHITGKMEDVEWLRNHGGAILRRVQHMLKEPPQCVRQTDEYEICLQGMLR